MKIKSIKANPKSNLARSFMNGCIAAILVSLPFEAAWSAESFEAMLGEGAQAFQVCKDTAKSSAERRAACDRASDALFKGKNSALAAALVVHDKCIKDCHERKLKSCDQCGIDYGDATRQINDIYLTGLRVINEARPANEPTEMVPEGSGSEPHHDSVQQAR